MTLDKLLTDWNTLSNPDKIKYIFDYCDNSFPTKEDMLKWRKILNSSDLDITFPGLRLAFQSCQAVIFHKNKEPTKKESRHWQSYKSKYANLQEEKNKFSEKERALNIFIEKMRDYKLRQII